MADSPEKKGSGRPRNQALEEAKRRGRQLRSAQREGQPLFLSEGLSFADLENQPKGVGLVYDPAMLEPKCDWDKKHHENPERLRSVYERCKHYGLVDRCVKLEPRKATEKEILLCHTKKYYDTIKSTEGMYMDQHKELSAKYDGVYFHNKTFPSAMLAAGCTLEALNAVHHGRVRHSMALVRPPGHHAMKDKACGYCFFNNVAIAAKHAVENLKYERVLIVDWDVHHGQGTQYMFYDDPRVMYFSIHRYEHGVYWPNLRESDSAFVGEGPGQGFNINVPLNDIGMNDADYLAIFTQILLPIAYQFQPEVILMSAGYDAAFGCPEGEMKVSPNMFAHFTNLLKPLANGKLCFILEGGYCLKSLAESAAMTLRALLGDPCPFMGPLQPPSESIIVPILKAIQSLRRFWPCLKYQGHCPDDEEPEIFSKYKPPEDVKFVTPENEPEKYDIYDDYTIHSPTKATDFDKKIDILIKNTNLTVPPNRTCLVYDERMLKHRAISSPGHPERPDRIKRIFEKHRECGLLNRCKQLEPRFAEADELALVHDSDYIEQIKSFSEMGPGELAETEWGFNSIYLSPDVWEGATLATGCTLNVVDEVCSGRSLNGLAFVRPPGHHAESNKCCGFCFFDTVAVAAKYAKKNYPLKRVMILDWDVHHGNGVQHAFEDDPSVLYVSLHRYDYGFFYPGGVGGDYHQVGRGEGLGYNVNIPWNGITARDTEYIAAFQHVVMPIAYEFGPDLVLVSAGFDAAKGDPLGGMSITPEGYGHLTSMLMGLANGKLILVLEGGYNLISISESMATCTSVMLGDQCPEVEVSYPWPQAVESIINVQGAHEQYWKCLQYQAELSGPIAKALTPMEKLKMKDDPEALTESDSPEPAEDSRPGPKKFLLPGEEKIEQMFVRMAEQLKRIFGPALSSGSEPEDYADFADKMADKSKEEIDQSDGRTVDNKPDQSDAGVGDVSQSQQSAGDVKPSEQSTGDVSQSEQGAGDANPSGEELGACGGSNGTTLGELKKVLGLKDGEELHAVVPLPWCPHLPEVQEVPLKGLEVHDPCMECENIGENWVCLSCYEVHCSRYVNEHMLMHSLDTDHRVVLSYADLSVWCYACDSYVHNEILIPAKRAAHISKFDEDIPGL